MLSRISYSRKTCLNKFLDNELNDEVPERTNTNVVLHAFYTLKMYQPFKKINIRVNIDT